MTTTTELRAIAEFDQPFTVDAVGAVTDAPAGTYAPEVYHVDDAQAPHDVDIMSGYPWEQFSGGYTGQYGYNGAVMHASEYLGGRLATDILATPGTYVVCAVECLPVPAFPHAWSPSGARCTRCPVAGTGDPENDGPCEAHPDYSPDVDAFPDDGPAGWVVLRLAD